MKTRGLLAALSLVLIGLVFVTIAAADPQQRPIRRYEVDCNWRFSDRIDPLLKPGVPPTDPNASHRHDFVGNRNVTENSTGSQLLTDHRSDAAPGGAQVGCADIGDGAAYWAPSILMPDGTTWKALKDPDGMHGYYRAYQKFEDYPIIEVPVGFGMVSNRHHWSCPDRTDDYDYIPGTNGVPACPQPDFVGVVEFPDCWIGDQNGNGQYDADELFRTDGTHVKFRYPEGGNPNNAVCDASHPVRIAEITLVFKYIGRCTQSGYLNVCRLSTFQTGGTGAHTEYHADFFNAWEPDDESGYGGQQGNPPQYDKQQILIDICLNIAVQESNWCKDDGGQHIWPMP